MIDPATLTDEELELHLTALTQESERRRILAAEDEALASIQKAAAEARGKSRNPRSPWIKPTGPDDSYLRGEVVTRSGVEWESLIPYNVWEPNPSLAGNEFRWKDLTDVEPDPDTGVLPWTAGEAVAVGDIRSYVGVQFSCRQAHTTQTGWEPPKVPALWQVVYA